MTGARIGEADADALRATLAQWAISGDFQALRTTAIVHLAWGSALKLREMLALQIGQVCTVPQDGRPMAIHNHGYLDRWNTARPAGEFLIPRGARNALRSYILEGISRGWVSAHRPLSPLWVTSRGGGHGLLSPRAAQYSWTLAQQRAGLKTVYHLHALRHDAIARYAEECGDVAQVQRFGRLRDVRTAQSYLPAEAGGPLAEYAERRPATRAGRGRS